MWQDLDKPGSAWVSLGSRSGLVPVKRQATSDPVSLVCLCIDFGLQCAFHCCIPAILKQFTSIRLPDSAGTKVTCKVNVVTWLKSQLRSEGNRTRPAILSTQVFTHGRDFEASFSATCPTSRQGCPLCPHWPFICRLRVLDGVESSPSSMVG